MILQKFNQNKLKIKPISKIQFQVAKFYVQGIR